MITPSKTKKNCGVNGNNNIDNKLVKDKRGIAINHFGFKHYIRAVFIVKVDLKSKSSYDFFFMLSGGEC